MNDTELAALVERDYLTYATSFRGSPGVTILDEPELLARRGPPDDYLNLVLGTWTDDAGADGLVERVCAALGGPGRAFTWSIWPTNRPASLGDHLARHGFVHEGDGPLMVLDLAASALPTELPPGLAIERVTTAAALGEAADVTLGMMEAGPDAAAAFYDAYARLILVPDPPMRYFVGRMDGRIVGTSALYTGTGQAGVYAVTTVPELRGRGIGRAMTVAALAEGRRAGRELGVLLSSPLGEPVYRRLGFREVGSAGFWSSPREDGAEPVGSVSPDAPPEGDDPTLR